MPSRRGIAGSHASFFSFTPPAHTASHEAMVKNTGSGKSKTDFEKNLQKLNKGRFDPTTTLSHPTPILQLKGITICTAGNISNIQGPAKSAKSSVMGAAIAAILRSLLGKPEATEETLGFDCKLGTQDNELPKRILHFDTEQSPYHHYKFCMDILKRAKITIGEQKTLPFESYSLVNIDHHQRRNLIEHKATELARHAAGNGIACLFLDGVADIISDPNDARESFEVVEWLRQLAVKHQTTVITILHENPTDAGKARGHLGSQIIRKCETNLRVAKGKAGTGANAVSTIWVERARGIQIPESDGVKISWCRDKDRHTIHDASVAAGRTTPSAPKTRPSSRAKKPQAIKDWLMNTALKKPATHRDLVASIMQRQQCKERTAKTRIQEWVAEGLIHKTGTAKSAPYACGPAPEEQS